MIYPWWGSKLPQSYNPPYHCSARRWCQLLLIYMLISETLQHFDTWAEWSNEPQRLPLPPELIQIVHIVLHRKCSFLLSPAWARLAHNYSFYGSIKLDCEYLEYSYCLFYYCFLWFAFHVVFIASVRIWLIFTPHAPCANQPDPG